MTFDLQEPQFCNQNVRFLSYLLLPVCSWWAHCTAPSQSGHWLSHCIEMYVQSPHDLSCRIWRLTCRTTESFTPSLIPYLYMKAYCSLVLDRPNRSLTLTAYVTELCVQITMKGTEVPNPQCSSACDCTCVLTGINHCLVNNSIMTFALELIWHDINSFLTVCPQICSGQL